MARLSFELLPTAMKQGNLSVEMLLTRIYPEAMQHVVTLVHGTWGQRSSWISPTSPLCRTISTYFGRDVHFDVFQWSGRNSFAERELAASRLQMHLQDLFSKFHDACFYVVAHSHGGNVVARALDDKVAARLRAVVFLATPFVIVRHRPESRARLLKFGFQGIALLALFLAYTFSVRFLSTSSYVPLALAFLVGCSFLGGFRILRKRATACKDVIESSVGFGVPRFARALVVIADGDEARYALTALQFASSLLELFLRVTLSWYVLLPMTLAVLVTCAAYLTTHPVSVLAFTMVLLAPAILPGTIAIAVAIPICVLAVGLGLEFVLGSLMLEISVESTPLGVWPVCQIRSDEKYAGLRHTAPYAQGAVLVTICDWMVRKEDKYVDKTGS